MISFYEPKVEKLTLLPPPLGPSQPAPRLLCSPMRYVLLIFPHGMCKQPLASCCQKITRTSECPNNHELINRRKNVFITLWPSRNYYQ